MLASIADKIVLKTFGNNLSKDHFRLFDRSSQTWKVVSFDDARQRTLMTLRLKAYFGGKSKGIFKFAKSKGTPRPIKSVVARQVTASQETVDDKVVAPSSEEPPSLLQMQSTDSINVPVAPRHMTFVARPGAKNPVPSDLQSAARPSSPDPTFALLEEMLLSPESSNPEKEAALLQAGIMSPNISPAKSFIHKIPTISQFGQEPMCFVQPLARRPANLQPRAPVCFLPDTQTSSVFQPSSASWGSIGGFHHRRLMSQASNPTPVVQEAHPAFRSLNSPLNVILFPQYERQQIQQPYVLPRLVGTSAWARMPVPSYSTNQQPSKN